MPDVYNSKVVLATGEVLIDLTNDTADESKVLSGYTFHKKNGAPATGSCEFDVDSSLADADASEILYGKKAAVRGTMITGLMPNNGSVSGEIDTLTDGYVVPQGYHDGGGRVNVNAADKAKIVPGNIKSGVEILGVTGTYSGEDVNAQTKSATPTFSAQVIQPDQGYDYLAAVNLAAISVIYTDNPAGGKTVTIGAV